MALTSGTRLGPYETGGAGRSYDVSPDGRRFLMIRLSSVAEDQEADPVRLLVVENWFEDLKARVPVTK